MQRADTMWTRWRRTIIKGGATKRSAFALEVLTTKAEMRILLFSTLLYLIGVAAGLYLRPALMFRPDGTWKEFGLADQDSTVFPFWLFCIVWALASFLLGRILFSEGRGEDAARWLSSVAAVGSASAAPHTLTARFNTSLTEENIEAGVEPLPVSKPKRGGGSVMEGLSIPSGYFKLLGGGSSGKSKKKYPRYVFVPAEDEDTSSSEED